MSDLLLSAAKHLDENSIPEPNSGCVLWTGRTWSNGRYGAIDAGMASRLGIYMAHRLAYVLAKGPIPAGLCVCHKCDVTHCVNPDHLFLGTRKENMADMVRKGRRRGGPSKLSEDDARAIRADKRPLKEIAAAFGVTRAYVCNVKAGRYWPHVPA